jgi:hypothetical protein
MTKDRILDGSSRGLERQAGSLSYIAPRSVFAVGAQTRSFDGSFWAWLVVPEPTYNCLPALGPKAAPFQGGWCDGGLKAPAPGHFVPGYDRAVLFSGVPNPSRPRSGAEAGLTPVALAPDDGVLLTLCSPPWHWQVFNTRFTKRRHKIELRQH